MLAILRDLLKYNLEFRIGIILVGIVVGLAALSGFSPYPPGDVYVVPPDVPPSGAYWFGTTSRGQDVFWQVCVAIRNTLLFGVTVAAISRVLSLVIGLLSGYKGGWVDRALMAVNDTFIVIPLFPILVLFYFVMRDSMTWLMLAMIMATLGWAYDARLIRAVAMSLKTREFSQTAVFSGMSTREILTREHLPYVMPIVFSTTMNNMNWSIGLEVTLSVLGFTDINTPTIGGMIYWANQHTAIVAGVWWWIAFPIAVVIMAFVGLFLLAVSMNEYIDPRSRLSRMGGGAR
jgi:peptide/nickel transport system permease protein